MGSWPMELDHNFPSRISQQPVPSFTQCDDLWLDVAGCCPLIWLIWHVTWPGLDRLVPCALIPHLGFYEMLRAFPVLEVGHVEHRPCSAAKSAPSWAFTMQIPSNLPHPEHPTISLRPMESNGLCYGSTTFKYSIQCTAHSHLQDLTRLVTVVLQVPCPGAEGDPSYPSKVLLGWSMA